MLPNIRVIPNLSKVLVAGLVLGVIPYVVTGYIFPRACQNPSSRPIAHDASKTAQLPPRLFPAAETAQPLHPSRERNPMLLTSATPEDQPAAEQALSETKSEVGGYTNAGEDLNPQTRDLELAPPELGPALNSPLLPDRSPASDSITTAPPSEPYPSTDAPMGPMMSEAMPLETRNEEPEAVPSPAASMNHGSVPPEAAYSHPAVQRTTLPVQPAHAPAEPKLLQPSFEPAGLPAAQSAALPARSEQLESMARQADQEIRHGFELAGRGAYYAARSEFIAALRLVAQGLDTDRQTTIHGRSLAAGLTALKEAEDFLPRGSMIEAHLDIPALVASHATPVLKNADNAQITALVAVKSYMTYAQEQFAAAAENEFAGSMALRALGKLHEELALNQRTEIQAAATKAVVFYQAALLVAPENYLAANDLGVMLAKAGNLQGARSILEHSAATSPHSTVLRNLAKVYQRLGYRDLAAQTGQHSLWAQQAEQSRRQTTGTLSANGSVQWVAPETFAQTSPNLSSQPAIASNPATPPQVNQTIRQPSPAPSKTNSFGNNNPHWSPNYQQPPVMGQLPATDYQR